jgi:hypothetical protein
MIFLIRNEIIQIFNLEETLPYVGEMVVYIINY